VLPAAAETPTCFTIWCRFFIWSLTQNILRFYGDEVELMLMMIPVTLEGSPFWIYNHAHQRIQEVSSLTLLHKDRILVKNQIRTASSLFILTLQSLETECTARIKKQRPMSVGFPLGCCYHTTLCVTTVASRTEEVTCSHLHFPIEVNARLE
jgi:hypothetical protein